MSEANCAVCRLPLFSGASGYVGAQCQCYWNQRRHFEANPGAVSEEHELKRAEAELEASKQRVETAKLRLAMKRAAIARATGGTTE